MRASQAPQFAELIEDRQNSFQLAINSLDQIVDRYNLDSSFFSKLQPSVSQSVIGIIQSTAE
jgi:hypothetical protein